MRNENSRFSENPVTLDIQRSTFNRSSTYKTSANIGELIPFYYDEVLPGDTFQVKTNKVVRLQPLVSAPMDNLYFDTYYFFVPNRLVWEHWEEFMGENKQGAWIPQTEYTIPQITSPASTGFEVGTIADYFGIPTGVPNLSVSALPFRAYALIVDEWFRDQNLQLPLNIPLDDTTVQGVNTGDYVTDTVKGGKPFVAAKYHDYFTSCLPSPQKGPDVTIAAVGDFPVYTGDPHNNNGSNKALHYGISNISTGSVTFSQGSYIIPSALTTGSTQNVPAQGKLNVSNISMTTSSGSPDSTFGSKLSVYPDNLYASSGTATTINQLRMAFQIQKLYEKDARAGSRYRELIRSHFSVTPLDSRMQVPEYLGGNRIPININQVVQTSQTSDVSPQGNVAGQSLTSDSHGDFIKSFTEHGMLIGVAVARYDHTYQQGVSKLWSRKTRFDYYWPVLANIGEQAVLNKEIYAQGTAQDDEVFGYQEAWAEYRYKPSIVTGEMRSSASTSLDSWHFADDYSALPKLGADWIKEDKTNIDRVLAVSSSVSNQYFADFYIENETTRALPFYSIPGLIDHH